MPYAVNQGVRIHYRIEGDGQPLVLQHGFTDSLETWYETGYVEGPKTDYRLILIDARGHGASDKLHSPIRISESETSSVERQHPNAYGIGYVAANG